jgi:hypothetical protein
LPAQLFERNGEHIFLNAGPAFATSPFDSTISRHATCVAT